MDKLKELDGLLARLPDTTAFAASVRPQDDPDYIQGFVRGCAEAGIGEKRASVMLQEHLLFLALGNDPSFSRGFHRVAHGIAH
jgi:hypothetical protein